MNEKSNNAEGASSMGANSAIKKLHLDDDNDNVAARLQLLAEQLQLASSELTEVVSQLRKDEVEDKQIEDERGDRERAAE